jgi:type III secretion protein Q
MEGPTLNMPFTAESAAAIGYSPFIDQLPHYQPAQVAVLNALHRRYAPIELSFGGRALVLSIAVAQEPIEAAESLRLNVGDCGVLLHLCRNARDLLSAGSPVDWARAPAPLRGLLFEYVLLDAIKAVEGVIGSAIRFGAEPEPAASIDLITLAFALAEPASGIQARAWLQCPTDLLSDIAVAFGHRAPAPNAMAGLLLDTRLEAGTQYLTASDLRSLRPGDVVMLERPSGEYQLNVSDRFYAPCRRSDAGTVRLTGAVSRSISSEESVMAANNDHSNPSSGAFDDVPVRLVCEVGRVELTLGDLRSLGDGSVLAVGGDLTEPVRLVANGKCVGRGELVKLGSGLGVRVTSFASDE